MTKHHARKSPLAPKRAKSAFIFFSLAKREEFKAIDSYKDVSNATIIKEIAEAWRKLGEDGKTKFKYLAQQDKQRYVTEMARYNGPLRVPNERFKKDPGAPKRCMPAFLYFSQVMRPRLKAEFPDKTNLAISCELGVRWKAADEGERAPYVEAERRDRQRYQRETAVWKAENLLRAYAPVDGIAAAVATEAANTIVASIVERGNTNTEALRILSGCASSSSSSSSSSSNSSGSGSGSGSDSTSTSGSSSSSGSNSSGTNSAGASTSTSNSTTSGSSISSTSGSTSDNGSSSSSGSGSSGSSSDSVTTTNTPTITGGGTSPATPSSIHACTGVSTNSGGDGGGASGVGGAGGGPPTSSGCFGRIAFPPLPQSAPPLPFQ